MKTLLQLLGIVVLLAIEGYAAYAALHPHVSPEYRAYFIDRTTHDWVAQHYKATPESGIQFGKPGWPEFVTSSRGFSNQEDWGRWTDTTFESTPQIIMARHFEGPLCVEIVAHPSQAERGKTVQVALGNDAKQIVLSDPEFKTYDLSFQNAQPWKTLEFRFSGSVPRNDQLAPGHDPRRLGIAISSLRILPHTCTSR